MSSQDEYLRNFAVLLTEKGVVALTDPMQIAVYNCLTTGSKRPSDISAEFSIPSSSLHFVLDKMVDAGVIIRSKPNPEKKSVYYSNLAMKIAGSFESDENAAKTSENTFKDPSRYYSGLSSVASMFDNYTSEIGLELDQLRSKYAIEYADHFKDDIGKCGIEDAIIKIREIFARTTGTKFSVFGLNPLTLVFEGDIEIKTKMDMFTQFIIRAVENATDRTYIVLDIEDYSNESGTRMKVGFDRIQKVPEPYLNTSLHQNNNFDRFMMIELDGVAGLMTSDVQLDIVDAVYERPLCITDIVNKIQSPRSTITSNLLRMVEEGIISVFYSESGSAYYGLSCSILMKKSRPIQYNKNAIGEILKSVKAKECAFLEGYFRYTLAVLNNLGFDTDYMMVVLGARYMRAAGNEGPKNFDAFFGMMSDIAQVIGLSLNIVSVYPLTIGINNTQSSEMKPAITFVKGMAHQGLEMASDGIFVRSSNGTLEQENISFREIYPALSMTPVEGVRLEELADAAPAKKKRTSSVKTALHNRSMKDTGKPARTVRYITAVVMLMFVSSLMLFSFGSDSGSDADAYTVDVDDSSMGLVFYDENDEILTMPISVGVGSTISFKAYIPESDKIGVVKNGIAYPLEPTDDRYEVVVDSDITIETLSPIILPECGGYNAGIYNFDENPSSEYANSFQMYISQDDYIKESGGLWGGSNCIVVIDAVNGSYVSPVGDEKDTYLWERYVSWDLDLSDYEIEEIPENHYTIMFDGKFEVDGKFVKGELKTTARIHSGIKFISTDGPVQLMSIDANGKVRNLNIDDGMFRLYVYGDYIEVDYQQNLLK